MIRSPYFTLALALLAFLTACTSTPSPTLPPTVSATLIGATDTPQPYPPRLIPPTRPPLPEGYVPPPTLTPWPPPTFGPSPTPLPTETPWPSATPTSLPTVIPPVQFVNYSRLPPITYDVLFLENSSLMRWNHTTRQIETLVGPTSRNGTSGVQHKIAPVRGGGPLPGSVVVYSVSANGQKAALVRPVSISPTGALLYVIALLDLRTSQIITLPQVLSDGNGLQGTTISPNGAWVAYRHEDAEQRVIYAVQTEAPYQQVEIGSCNANPPEWSYWACDEYIWSADSQAILWVDGQGLSVTTLGHAAQNLVTHASAMPNTEAQGFYYPMAWSPLGRYALIWIGFYEGRAQGILDTQTRVVKEIPGTHEYPDLVAQTSWLRDGRLFVTKRGSGIGGGAPYAEIWRIDPTDPNLLINDATFYIHADPWNVPASPTQFADGRLAFALWNTDNLDYQPRGLYVIDPETNEPHKVTGLPPAASDSFYGWQAVWAPDGSGAIVRDESARRFLYAPSDGSALYDLRPMLNEFACCFTWVAPP